MYAEPVQLDLVTERIKEMKAAGITTAASVTPQKTEQFAPALLAAELDLLVIQGTVVSAEHVSKTVGAPQPQAVHPRIRDPGHRRRLRLLPGRPPPDAHRCGGGAGRGRPRQCLHHPRVLGIGVPQATAIADVAGARMRHLDETGSTAT